MAADRSRPAPGHGPAGYDGGPDGAVGLEQDFDAGSLYGLRSAVGAHAAAAGLSRAKVYDVVAVAHELAANAVLHGGGHGRLRLQSSGWVLTCQVSDPGPTPADSDGEPAAVTTAPWPAEYSHGLWLVRQVADTVTIDTGPAGTTATATFTLRLALVFQRDPLLREKWLFWGFVVVLRAVVGAVLCRAWSNAVERRSAVVFPALSARFLTVLRRFSDCRYLH